MNTRRNRYLIINADDYGIGPATSRGILDLARAGLLSSTVLLVNSPHAPAAIELWKKAGRPIEIGWHPVLTLDSPVLRAGEVHSLVDAHGQFFPLNVFLKRLFLGKINPSHIQAELAAQYQRCCDLLGKAPTIVNTHHHVQIFAPVGAILREILAKQQVTYLRLVREPWPRLMTQPGARIKRLVLNYFGRREARRQRQCRFLGNDWLTGVVTNNQGRGRNLFAELIRGSTGNVIELTCHPGLRDETLIGRDCSADDGMLERRTHEMAMLADSGFREACIESGLELITPQELGRIYQQRDVEAPLALAGDYDGGRG